VVSERSLEVLKAIVRDYVASREPVGSKTIVERHAFGVSAATIRNDMAQLEDEQLIAAPHTSSGRVPTDKGYRVFVDHLAGARPLSSAQRHAIETFLGAPNDLDEVLGRTVRLLSQLTNQVALVQYPSMVRARVQHIELVQSASCCRTCRQRSGPCRSSCARTPSRSAAWSSRRSSSRSPRTARTAW